MDLSAILRDKTICTCKYCGWKGKPWHTECVYICVDWVKKTRTVANMCPKCRTLSSTPCKEVDD